LPKVPFWHSPFPARINFDYADEIVRSRNSIPKTCKFGRAGKRVNGSTAQLQPRVGSAPCCTVSA